MATGKGVTITKATAEVQKLVAEARAHEAEAVRAELEAEHYRLRNDALARELLSDAMTPGNFNEYMFYNPVVEQTVAKAMFDMSMWARKRPEMPFTITFNSPGGTVTDGFALYDFIRSLSAKGHKVTTKCMGIAASMGAILMQAGDERVMTPTSYLMIHEVSSVSEGRLSELEDAQKVVKKFQNDALAILAKRSTLTVDKIQTRWRKKDWYMSPTEALDLGFIDRIEE